jgi:hypothetical protein
MGVGAGFKKEKVELQPLRRETIKLMGMTKSKYLIFICPPQFYLFGFQSAIDKNQNNESYDKKSIP